MGKTTVPDLMTRSEAAKALGVTTEWVRQLEIAGTLKALHTAGGRPLYLAADVERLRVERAKAGR